MSTVVDLMAASDDEGDEIEYVGTLPADEAEVAAPLAPPSPTAPPSDNEEEQAQALDRLHNAVGPDSELEEESDSEESETLPADEAEVAAPLASPTAPPSLSPEPPAPPAPEGTSSGVQPCKRKSIAPDAPERVAKIVANAYQEAHDKLFEESKYLRSEVAAREAKLNEMRKRAECKICMSRKRCMAGAVCGHLVCCAKCYESLQVVRFENPWCGRIVSCPICRAEQAFVRIYVP